MVTCRPGSGASLDHVEALLEAYPDGAQVAETRRGWLPLHFAAAKGASLEVVNKLLEYYPEGAAADDLDKLHPLHHAVQAQAHKDIVGALYLANPDSARYGVPSSLGGPLRGKLAPEGATSGVYDDDGNLIPL